MIGARVPLDWQQQIQEITTVAKRKEAFALQEVLTQDLGRTTPGSVKDAIAYLQDWVASLDLDNRETVNF